jgi:hypothetical protein
MPRDVQTVPRVTVRDATTGMMCIEADTGSTGADLANSRNLFFTTDRYLSCGNWIWP